MISHTDTFDNYGNDFWKENGPFKTLHEINPARVQFISRYLPDIKNKKILDIGCGGGLLSESLANLGANVFGIDLSSSMINAAQEHMRENNLSINYRQISSNQCLDLKEKYDAIVCMEMLEHISDPSKVIQDSYDLLNDGGLAFFSTINRNIHSYLGAIIAAEKIFKIVPEGTHTHSSFIKPEELCAMAEKIGFKTLGLSGMTYLPFIKKAYLSSNVNINYLAVFKK